MAQVVDLRRRVRNTLNRTSQAFIRSESLNKDGNTYAITDVDTANDSFTISGDQTGDPNLTQDYHIWVYGSTGNDAIFQINSVSLDGSGDTEIFTVESIEDPTIDGTIAVDKDYDYVNFGRVKETSIETEVVQSDMDQDGRTSSNLLEFNVSMTLQQARNTELSIQGKLNQPPSDGPHSANTLTYPRGYDFYPNGHFVYFSGDQGITTAQVNNAVNDTNATRDDGELLTQTDIVGQEDIHKDVDGILFQNVLISPGPTLDLSGGQNLISIEFGGTVHFDELNSLETDRKISMSPSDFFFYA